MKKIFATILVLALCLTAFAFAAEIKPFVNVDMAADLNDCILHVGVKLENVSAEGLIADIYDEQRYDAVEVSQIAAGDVITCLGEEITVETVEVDYSTLINGGDLENDETGVTLCPDEGGTYIALQGECPAYLMLGTADFAFADEVVFNHYIEEEDGSINLEEMDSVTLAAADVAGKLADEGDAEFYPDSLTIRIEDHKIVEVSINYVP